MGPSGFCALPNEEVLERGCGPAAVYAFDEKGDGG